MTHPFESLTPDCVVDCVEAIGLRSDLRLLALNSFENRVYQVGIEEADPVIVKFYRPGAGLAHKFWKSTPLRKNWSTTASSVVAPMGLMVRRYGSKGLFDCGVPASWWSRTGAR